MAKVPPKRPAFTFRAFSLNDEDSDEEEKKGLIDDDDKDEDYT